MHFHIRTRITYVPAHEYIDIQNIRVHAHFLYRLQFYNMLIGRIL